jgi:methylmalonyl-CoA/ethylmalonyl-CoA epimerase
MNTARRILLDHLAVGTQTWADGYPELVNTLGGRWLYGGDTGEFSPCQMVYSGGMHLEIISPGPGGGGFMQRFLDRGGPGPHHLTFAVPSLDAVEAKLSARGVSTFGGRREPFWRESFLHPKTSGAGTLIQLAEQDQEALHRNPPPAPPGFPPDPPEPADIAWIALTADSVAFAETLFGDVLDAAVTESGDGWRLFSWGPQRRLLVRQSPAEPGGPALWKTSTGNDSTGVAHLAVGPVDTSPARLSDLRQHQYDPRLGLPVWSVAA